MTAFAPKYLSPDQIRELYTQALVQAEVAVTSAWINLQTTPADPMRRHAYEAAAAALAALEADLARLTAPPGEGYDTGCCVTEAPP